MNSPSVFPLRRIRPSGLARCNPCVKDLPSSYTTCVAMCSCQTICARQSSLDVEASCSSGCLHAHVVLSSNWALPLQAYFWPLRREPVRANQGPRSQRQATPGVPRGRSWLLPQRPKAPCSCIVHTHMTLDMNPLGPCNIYIYTYIHTHTHIYICVYIYIYVS